MRRGGGQLAQTFLLFGDPDGKLAGLGHPGKDESRRAGHPLRQQDGSTAARLRDRMTPTVVGGDEGGLRRGQRNEVVALGEETVHAQRADDAHWHTDFADQVLDVAIVDLGRTGVPGQKGRAGGSIFFMTGKVTTSGQRVVTGP